LCSRTNSSQGREKKSSAFGAPVAFGWLLGEMATFENIYEKNDDDDDEEEEDDDEEDDDDDEEEDDEEDDDDDDDYIYCKLRSYLYHRFCRNSIRR